LVRIMPESNSEIARDPSAWVSEDLLRSLIESVPDCAIFLLDTEGRVASWNQGAEKSLGYKAEEIIGHPLEQFFLAEDVQAGTPEQNLNAAVAEGRSESTGWRRRKDGSQFWARGTLTAIHGSAGMLQGCSCVIRDLSEQMAAEEAARTMKAQLELHRIISDSIDEYAIYRMDPAGIVNGWGPGAERVTGFKPEDVMGRHYSFFYTEEGIAAGEPERELEEAETTGRCRSEGWRRTGAGALNWTSGTLTALRDESGKLLGFMRMSHSMNKQKMLEGSLKDLAADLENRVAERTRQLESTVAELRQKNEEVEAFVYIVSHDLRAPLVNVLGFVKELQMSCAAMKRLLDARQLPDDLKAKLNAVMDEEITGSLNFIASSSQKFERLINALLRLSRQGRQVYQRVQVEMNSVAAGAVDGLQAMIEGATGEVQIAQLPLCFGDANALGQVFSILIANAVKYRDPQRALRIEVGGIEEGGLSHYWVQDNGLGIPEAGKSRLFQVFQRLHPQQGAGEGMGLAIAHRIIERHGGKIWAESREGQETTFHFTLPHRAPRRASGEQP
jgi:PAS domain S-box-containing protein